MKGREKYRGREREIERVRLKELPSTSSFPRWAKLKLGTCYRFPVRVAETQRRGPLSSLLHPPPHTPSSHSVRAWKLENSGSDMRRGPQQHHCNCSIQYPPRNVTLELHCSTNHLNPDCMCKHLHIFITHQTASHYPRDSTPAPRQRSCMSSDSPVNWLHHVIQQFLTPFKNTPSKL